MSRLPAFLHRHSIWMAVVFFFGSAWFVSIFAAYSFKVNLPVLSRSFSIGQSDGMVGFSSYSRRATVDFGCGGPVLGSMSGPICLWKNPHNHPSFEVPLPVRWEVNEYYWSFGVSYWFASALLFGAWKAWASRRSRRMKELSLQIGEMVG